MSIWLVRAGSKGQYEDKFLSDKRIYLTWGSLDVDLNKYKNREKLLQIIADIYSSEKPNTIKNWASQIYPIPTQCLNLQWSGNSRNIYC